MYIFLEEIMGFILYRIETYGMKNINDKITIDFQNQTINRKNNKKQAVFKDSNYIFEHGLFLFGQIVFHWQQQKKIIFLFFCNKKRPN